MGRDVYLCNSYIFISVRSRCPSHLSDWLFSYHSESMAKNMKTLMAHLVPMLTLALMLPPQRLHPPNSWMTLLSPPSALTLKQFFLHHILSLIRVLIYSSSCLLFRRLLLSRRLPTSMTILPTLLLLQCPDGSYFKTLTLMLVSPAFAWHCQTFAECSCHVHFCIDPDGPRCHCCCYHCRLLCIIVVIIVIAVVVDVIVVAATAINAELLPVELLRCHFPLR